MRRPDKDNKVEDPGYHYEAPELFPWVGLSFGMRWRFDGVGFWVDGMWFDGLFKRVGVFRGSKAWRLDSLREGRGTDLEGLELLVIEILLGRSG